MKIDYDAIEAGFKEQRELLKTARAVHDDNYEAAFQSYVANMDVDGEGLMRWTTEYAAGNLRQLIQTRISAGETPVLPPDNVVSFVVAAITRGFTMGLVMGREKERQLVRDHARWLTSSVSTWTQIALRCSACGRLSHPLSGIDCSVPAVLHTQPDYMPTKERKRMAEKVGRVMGEVVARGVVVALVLGVMTVVAHVVEMVVVWSWGLW